jgi:UDP-4-amino-4,6-dideoxy-N-acetyl-beta-L-altrosamine transaminase
MENNIIPYGKQNITDDDIEAVVKALKGEFLTQGPTILEFEKKFSDYIGCKYSIAVSNGTAALHLAALAIGLKKGDKVITTPLTFAATANCIRYSEGEVVFSDIDSNTLLIDINKIEKLLKSNPKGTFKGIIPVDFAGRACNLEKLRELADEFGLWIIEDACHAPGGYFIDSKGDIQYCGNSQFADLSVFSFHPVKHIATGEGGMITTNNEDLYYKILKLRTHGITKKDIDFTNSIDFANGTLGETDYPGWYMEMQNLGFNYRFTDFQAALGISQLNRAETGLKRRREIAKKYNISFNEKSYIINHTGFVEGHAYHLYVIEVKDRLGLYNYLKQNDIFSQVHYIPCHLMPYYRNLGWKEGDMINSETYYKNCLSIPIYPGMSDDNVDLVISKIDKFYE